MSETLTPVFRLEYFITAAASGTPCDLEPIFNEEKYLHAIAGASVDLPMPVGRTQEYLAKLAGMDVEIPDKPIYRTEYYLAHMIDNTVECPAPVFREEMFYYEWASNEYVTIVGNPVSFTAVSAPLRQLEVAFSPKQDLHGYDAPWPAGGGINLLNYADTSDSYRITSLVDNGDDSYTITASGASAYIQHLVPVVAGQAYNIYYASAANIEGNAGQCGVAAVFDGSDNTAPALLSGVSVNTEGGKQFTPTGSVVLVRCQVTGGLGAGVGKVTKPRITKGATQGAYSPYSNECPISGWSSLTVEQRGKNLLTWAETYDKAYYSGEWHGTGDKVTNFTPSTAKWVSVRVLVKGLSAVTVSGMPSVGGVNGVFEFADGTVDYAGRWGSNQHNGTHAVPNGAVYMWMGVQISETDIRTAYPNAMAEIGTTATEYVPYNGRSISISLGSTVYSGTVDVVTGQGEVTHGIVDLSSVTWTYQGGDNNRAYAGIADMKNAGTGWNKISVYCDTYAIGSVGSGTATDNVIGVNGVTCYLRDNRFTSTDEYRAGVTGHLVYELATPIPIQLTPQEVQSLAGDNTMWTDGESLTVEYRSN